MSEKSPSVRCPLVLSSPDRAPHALLPLKTPNGSTMQSRLLPARLPLQTSSIPTMTPKSLGSVSSLPSRRLTTDALNATRALLFGLPEDDSPYPEVRSAVANYDDPSMPVATLRAWTLGILWAMILPGINEFYYFRYPSLMVTGVRVPSALLVPSQRPFRASSAPPPRFSILKSLLAAHLTKP